MTKKYLYTALVLLPVAIVAALLGWLRRDSAIAEHACVVQDQCAWAWPLNSGDTVFQSLDGRRFSLTADSVCTAYYGIAQINLLGMVSLPRFFLPQKYTTPVSDSLHALRDSVSLLHEALVRETDELAYYHNTHSPTASGYHVISEMRTSITQRSRQMDSLLSLWPDTMPVKPLLWHHRTLWRMDAKTGRLVHYHPRYKTDSDQNWLLRMGIDTGWRSWHDGIYRGSRDSIGDPHGSGTYLTYRQLYTGEWQHGKRDGVGIGIEPERIVMSGAWAHDSFRGEESYYDSTSVFGIDISRYQHDIECTVRVRKRYRRRYVWVKQTKTVRYGIRWSALRISSIGANNNTNVHGQIDFPVSFVYIKATQGTSIASRYYASDAAQARRHRIPVGAYHFFSIRGGVAQARYFLSVANPRKGDMPPVLDVELTDNEIYKMGGSERMIREMTRWLEVVRAHCGTAPVLYVSQRFVDRYLSDPDSPLRDYPVWIARYSNYRPYVRLSFWQLTPYGRVGGITGPVDIDVFNGTHGQFTSWYHQHACL